MRALMHRDFGARDLGPAAMAAAIPRPPLSGSRNTWCRSPAAASSELNACSRPRRVPKYKLTLRLALQVGRWSDT